jgi:hypothetical protein
MRCVFVGDVCPVLVGRKHRRDFFPVSLVGVHRGEALVVRAEATGFTDGDVRTHILQGLFFSLRLIQP